MDKTKLTEQIYKEIGCEDLLTLKFIGVVLDAIKLFDRKQSDYGTGNISKFGEVGVIVRVSDKIERQANLIGKESKNESKDDTWFDISCYGVIGLLCSRGLWPDAKRFSMKEVK